MGLTLGASLVNSNNRLLVAGVDGLEGLALDTLYELAIDEQAEGLLVGDARGLDLLCQRHGCSISEEWGYQEKGESLKGFNRQEERRVMKRGVIKVIYLKYLSAGKVEQ